MIKYVVNVREVWVQSFDIHAENKEHAIKLVRDNSGAAVETKKFASK